MDKSFFALESFKNIQELIRFIDQKAGGVLVVYGFVLTIFGDRIKELKLINPFSLSKAGDVAISLLTFLVGLALVVVLLFQIKILIFDVLRPRLAKNYNPNEYSLYYFEHIANMSKTEYISRVNAISEADMADQIHGQIYEVSKILNKKMGYMQKAMFYLYIVFGLLLGFLVCINFL